MPAVLRRRVLPKPAPEADPRFRRVMEQVRQGAARTKSHPPAARKAQEAGAAAKGPPNERLAAGKTRQVEKIQTAPTQKPKPQSFLEVLRAEIQAAMPKTLADTEDFMKGGKPDELKGSLKGNVSQQKEAASGGVKSASKEAPKEAGAAKPVTPLAAEALPAAPAVNGPEAMPAPKPEDEVSLQDSKQDVEGQMKDAEVTPQQCQKANDPRFSAVLGARDAVAKQADAGPAQYRASEKGVAATAVAGAKSAAMKGALAMVGVRGRSNSTVLSKQQAARLKEEQARKEVTDHIEQIYAKTKETVEAKLASLDAEVGQIFDTGTELALKSMTDYIEARIDAYKDDRYSGIIGKGRWVRDQFKGLPEEANKFYEEGRAIFTQLMDRLVVRVADLVETRLKEAKEEVAKGQAEIQKYVDGQPKELKSVALAAQKDVAGRFEELQQSIDDKKNQLAQQLAQKYKEAFDKANDALQKIRDANKGLVAAFVDKLVAIVKILLDFKDKLLSMLSRAASVIGDIVSDPIGFLSNLISAIIQGVKQFVSNIWEHIKRGFMKWLFGNLEGLGIELPTDFSLISILKLVLAVLGITYDRMRAKAVKLIGERAVSFIEKVVEYIKALITGGPAKLWELIKEDLSNLKEMVIDAIMSWVIETVIKQATIKLLSMFNPAGAIIQAILAIYHAIVFIIEKASQLIDFVNAVVDSIAAIVSGSLGRAANAIEMALAKMIPLVIGFLAELLGLGGISKKIRDFIEKVRNAVDKAIDKVIAKVVSIVKKVIGKVTGKKEEKAPEHDPQKEEKIAVGLQYLHATVVQAEKSGKLSGESAEAVAKSVRQKHPVFTQFRPVLQGDQMNFYYEASAGTVVAGAPSAGTAVFTCGNVTMKPLHVKDPQVSRSLATIRQGRPFKGSTFEMDVKLHLLSAGQAPSRAVTRDVGGELGKVIQADAAAQFSHVQSASMVIEPKEALWPSLRKRTSEKQREEHERAVAQAPTTPSNLTMITEKTLESEREGTTRRPDVFAEVFPVAGGAPEGVILVEITLQKDIRQAITTDRDTRKLHKPEQIFFTLVNIKEKYGPDIPVQYHIVTPAIDDPQLKADIAVFLNDTVARSGLTKAKIIWHMLS